MITPQEAFDICLKNVPNLDTDSVHEIINAYIICNCHKGDFCSESYKINKNTGEFSVFDEYNDPDYNQTLNLDDELLFSLPSYKVVNGKVVV